MERSSSEIEDLIAVVEFAGFEPTTYSGRNMYGRVCVGFTHEYTDIRAVAELVEAAQICGDIGILVEALKEARTDSMGRGGVMYFPSFEMKEEDEEESESVMCDP